MEISRIVVEIFSLTFGAVGSAMKQWWRLIWFSLCIYISAWTTVFAWGLRLIQVPGQLLTAPAREHKIASELAQLQVKYRGLQMINCDLEKKHKIALNEHRQIQQKLQAAVISEVNKATERSKLLKLRIKELEEQYIKLQESQRRASPTLDVHPPEKDVEIDFHSKLPVLEASPEGQTKKNAPFAVKPTDEAAHHIVPVRHFRHVDEKSCILEDHQSRRIAFVSSLFSASMCAVVAVIAWQATDPCLPLFFALFTVVGMSCARVVRFLSRVSHRFGMDAILLVSFNSFVLGTLAFPFLPYFAPKMMHMWWWILGWVGVKPETGDQNLLPDIFPSTCIS